jgi:hypothetical protein
MISASSAIRNTTPFCPVSDPSSGESLEKLEEEITYLAGFINAATCRFLLLVAEFDRRDGWHGAGMISCAHWLNWRCGIGMVAAREKVRVARALGEFDLIRSSFEKGEISYSKVRAMTRVATAENESVLMQVALHGTAHHVETTVRKYRRACDLQVLDQAKAQYEGRGLSYRHEEDDSIVIRIKLPPEQGEVVLKALQAVANRLWQEERDSAESSDAVSAQKSTPSQRRADALVAIAEGALAMGSLDNKSSSCNTGDRYLVTVHVGEETLSSGARGRCELENGPSLAVETARRLACDAGIVRIQEDSGGNVLNIGRKTRAIPPAMRRALNNRDKGCRFPGCTRKHFTDGHHIRHWADGGETRLDNLVLLCRHHHRLVHEGGFDTHVDDAGVLRFTTPAGASLPTAPAQTVENSPLQLQMETIQRNRGITIDPDTADSGWCGETIDYDHIAWLMATREADDSCWGRWN